MLPEGWIKTTLGEVAQISSGGTPDRSNPNYWGGDIPWVTTGEIRFNTITDSAEKITEAGLRNSSAKIFSAGTLLMAMYDQGKTRGQVAKLGIDAATNQACASIKTEDECDIDYLFQFLTSQYMAIRELGNSGTQQNLNGSLIKGIPLALPPKAEQIRIAQMVTAWDNAIALNKAQIQTLVLEKRTLMQDLMTGKRRVHIPFAGDLANLA